MSHTSSGGSSRQLPAPLGRIEASRYPARPSIQRDEAVDTGPGTNGRGQKAGTPWPQISSQTHQARSTRPQSNVPLGHMAGAIEPIQPDGYRPMSRQAMQPSKPWRHRPLPDWAVRLTVIKKTMTRSVGSPFG